MSYDLALPLIFIFSIGSLFVAGYLISWVSKRTRARPAMREISNAIKEGAEAFLRRQNTTILLLATLLAALIFVLYAFVRTHHDFDPVPTALRLAFWTTLSFVLGAALLGHRGVHRDVDLDPLQHPDRVGRPRAR